MASPSRSKSVASHRSDDRWWARRRAVTTFFFWSGTTYSGSKLRSVSTPILLSGRSRMWPMEAFTENSEPRYRSKVLALVGDSTITRFFAMERASLHVGGGVCQVFGSAMEHVEHLLSSRDGRNGSAR